MLQIPSCVRIGLAVLGGLAAAGPALAQGPYQFNAIDPCRVIDTRPNNALEANTAGGPVSSVTRKLQVRATLACVAVPATARAITFNATVVGATHAGHLTLYPSHLSAAPPISTLNFQPGVTTANGGIVKLNPTSPDPVNLDLAVMAVFAIPLGSPPAKTHFLLDITGFFQ